MSMNRFLAAAALAATGAFGAAEAQARDVDVQWSVTLGSPIYAPGPVYVHPAPIYRAPVAGYWHGGYHQPRYWDRDGDGIPNRYDHRYNPRWDRDGDGIPNRYDRHPGRGGHGGRDGRGWDGGHDRGGWQDGRGGPDGRGSGGRDGRGGRGH